MHSEENKVNSDNKNPKRKLKTPAQLTSLENFFNEHKYPSDKMKADVAQLIGLTEKQVSGWFCHRRLKDKRLANGRHDHSTVAATQDRASGLLQDSCGSTKQGDYSRYNDPRDNLSNGHAVEDNTSSESSSSMQDRFLSQKEDPYDMENSRYLLQNGPVHSKAKKNMGGYKPSGYLKLKGAVEHAAIIAVKMQLGSHYREDGPFLGVEFDDPPPEMFNIRDSKQHYSPASFRGRKQSGHGIKYGVPAPKMRYQDSDNEGANCDDTLYGSDNEDRNSHCQRKQRSPFLNYPGPIPIQKSPIDNMYEDSARDTKRKNRMRSNPDTLYGGRITTEPTKPWFQELDNLGPNTVQNDEFLSRPSVLGYNNFIETEQRAPFRKKAKSVKHHGERKAVIDGLESVGVDKHLERERPRNDYVTKATYSELPMEANRIKRSAMEIPSSFSEDETAQTRFARSLPVQRSVGLMQTRMAIASAIGKKGKFCLFY
ncbi:hypothetical protein ACFE04_028229 [Oxalis oulophora]